jgi:hypothetical protein
LTALAVALAVAVAGAPSGASADDTHATHDMAVRGCATLGLAASCADLADADLIVQAAATYAAGCMAPGGTCATAVEVARSALDFASACVVAVENGAAATLPVVVAPGGVTLRCDQLTGMGVALAGFALGVANGCDASTDSACADVFTGAAQGLDRAAGCLQAAMLESRVVAAYTVGSDLGCGNAVAALYREGEGLLSLLSGCVYGSADLCGTVVNDARWAADHLATCDGPLIVALSAVQIPVTPPLTCWQALDQVNSALRQVMGDLPGVPTTISPTADCSVTVSGRVPAGDWSTGSLAYLVPPCDAQFPGPTDNRTPGTSTVGSIAGRTCGYEERFDITHKWPSTVAEIGRMHLTNTNSPDYTATLSLEVDGHVEFAYTGMMQAEGNAILAKVQAKVETSARVHLGMKATLTQNWTIQKGTTFHWVYEINKARADGAWYITHEDCATETKVRNIVAPYDMGYRTYQEPYSG